MSKQISGPGLVTQTWDYNYDGGTGSYYTASAPWNLDSTTEPYIPPGSCSACQSTNTVKVTGPTSTTIYTFGTLYARNEGQLLEKQVEDLSSNVLQSTTYSYVSDTQAANEPFADIAGQDLLPNYISPMANRNRPVSQTVIAQDSATFTSAVNSFDAFARSTSETGSSSLGYSNSKTDTTGYADDLTRWVLGLTTVTATNGTVSAQTSYDSLDRPVIQFAFGRLVSTSAWNSDGTLASVTDGDGPTHTTSFSGWTRGVPETVTYADGKTESAVVNSAGWITSITDENHFTTNYGYDAMGRLASIAYPTGDDVAWNPTLLSFTPVSSSELGIPGGHWKQVVQTGNDYAVTYYDAFWRPLVSEHYDNTSSSLKAATLSQTAQRYDAGGRKVFTSYPANNITSYATANIGTHYSTYDALDRVTEVDQDWYLDAQVGRLVTTTAYLSGFKTQVTDPKGNITVTSYQAYGQPTTEWPVSISAPDGQQTAIKRDVFGKPQSLTRNGTALIRSYVYNAYQQLCKRFEPETSATAFGYDNAGNLAWSASGLPLPDPSNCDASAAQSSGRIVTRAYDVRNRVTALTYADHASDTTYGYAPDGALTSQTMYNAGQPVTTRYSYDMRRLLTGAALTLTTPNTKTFSIGYDYDANGHLLATTWPDSRTLSYAPNALGQPTQVGSYATGATYFPNGALASFNYGSGAVHTTSENTRGLISGSSDVLNGTAGMDFGYDYDGDGNVAAISDNLPSHVGNVDMKYDALDRLTEADSPMFGGDDRALYSYDVLDNLLTTRVGNVSYGYSYNNNNQLSALTGGVQTSYTYDVQGNLASKNQQPYQFDQGNRLRNVPGIASYLYDAAGRRVQKIEQGTGTLLDSQYSKAGQLLFQWNPATQDATDYIYLGDTLVAKVVAAPSGPPAPASINVPTTSSTGNITVSWSAVSGASSYVLQQQFNGGAWTQVYSGSATSQDFTGLGNGSYVYRVQACAADGCSDFTTSSAVVVQSPQPPASAPTLSGPSTSATGTYTLTWTAVAGATRYQLNQNINGTLTSPYNADGTSWTSSGLGNGAYNYQVFACNAVGCGPGSNGVAVSVLYIPAAPALISVPASSYSPSIAVSWSASTTANNYVLEESVNGGGWGVVYTGAATSTTATVSASGTYQFQVSACNASGCSGFTASGNVAVTLPPASAPSLSGPSSSSSGTFTLSWTAVAGATRYQLNQNINGSLTAVYNAGGTSWTSSNLGNGSYIYAVYACNVAGCSGSSSNGVTVNVLHVPAAPASVTAPTVATVGVAFGVQWSAVSGATIYNLRQTESGTRNAVTTAYSGSATSTAITLDARVDDDFQYAAQACNSAGCSGWTNAPHATYLENKGIQHTIPVSGGSL